MNQVIERKIGHWRQRMSQHVSVSNPAAIHISELYGNDAWKADVIGTSVEAFLSLLKQMQDLDLPFQPALSFHMESTSNQLTTAAPKNRLELESQLLDDEPPSLYLLDWEWPKHLLICEHYEVPILFDLISPPVDGIYTCYEEIRCGEDIRDNWEFGRNVSATYYPERYRERLGP
jgi:hypothetical protein